MNSLLIEIDEINEITEKKHGSAFLTELKDTLHELDKLPIDEIRFLVNSNDFKEDRDLIEKNFWKEFNKINKDDCSLDSALLLQHYGFNLTRKPYKEEILFIKDDSDDADEDE